MAHTQPHPAVVQKQLRPWPQGGKNLGVRQRRAVSISRLRVQIKAKAFSRMQLYRPVREVPYSQFRTLQIEHYPNGSADLRLNVSDQR
jgi:hypothetical protein